MSWGEGWTGQRSRRLKKALISHTPSFPPLLPPLPNKAVPEREEVTLVAQYNGYINTYFGLPYRCHPEWPSACSRPLFVRCVSTDIEIST